VKLESLSWAPEGKHGMEAAAWMAATLAHDGIITSISETSEQLTGYESREMIGRPITCLLADRSVFDVSQILETAGEEGTWSGEIAYRDRKGGSRNASCTVLALSCGGGSRAFLVFSSFAGPANAAAGANAEVKAVGNRLRSFAHEMNNPLAVIMGMAQLMLLNAQMQGRARSDMEKLYLEMQRVVRVIEKLHAYAYSLQQEEETFAADGRPAVAAG
jgi:PAS domain S-box-containing protein